MTLATGTRLWGYDLPEGSLLYRALFVSPESPAAGPR